MKGAIIGDIIGSAFNKGNKQIAEIMLFNKTSAFTDDTILTLATADSILNKKEYKSSLCEWTQKHPQAGYNQSFKDWAFAGGQSSYLSDGDGAARRISPIGFAAPTLEYALEEAEKTTIITHNIPERISAAKAVAATIFLAKSGKSKSEIKDYLEKTFGYDLSLSIEQMREKYNNGTAPKIPGPAAAIAFLNSDNFEDAIRKAVSIGGPSNTIACITGGIAEAYYKHIPKAFVRRALARITPDMEDILNQFDELYFKSTTEENNIVFQLR